MFFFLFQKNTDQTVESKMTKLKKVSIKILSNSSLYGLSRAVTTKLILNKLIWSICALISAFYGILIIGENYVEYHQYDVLTKTQTIKEHDVIFPSIVMCPQRLKEDSFIITSATFRNGTETSYPLVNSKNESLLEFSANAGDCIRFNAYVNNPHPLMTVNGTQLMSSFTFTIEYHDSFLIYVCDNYNVNSFHTFEGFNLEPFSEYRFGITKTSEIKQEEPYNRCLSFSDPTYRQFDCQQKCVYKKYAAKYNCSYVAWQSFLTNEFSDNRCLDEGMKERSQYRKDARVLNLAAMKEFEAGCLENCPKECKVVKYAAEMTTKTYAVTNETKFSFYLSDLYFVQTSQIPKVTMSSLIGNIGGTLGVFIGLNFLSMVELMEFIVEVFFVLYGKSKVRTNA